MKKLFLLILITGCCTLFGKAQRYYGQWACNITGIYKPGGFGAAIGTEKALGYTYSTLRGELIFDRELEYLNTLADVSCYIQSYTAKIGYTYTMQKMIPHAFYFYPSAGIITGLETFHGKLPKGVIRTTSNHFLLGFYLSVQAEIRLTRNVSFFFEPEGNYRIRTSGDELAFKLNAGFKFYIPR